MGRPSVVVPYLEVRPDLVEVESGRYGQPIGAIEHPCPPGEVHSPRLWVLEGPRRVIEVLISSSDCPSGPFLVLRGPIPPQKWSASFAKGVFGGFPACFEQDQPQKGAWSAVCSPNHRGECRGSFSGPV